MRLAPEQQARYLKSISSSFGFNIELTPLDTLALQPGQVQHINNGGIVPDFFDEQGYSQFYQKLSGTNSVIVLGPIYYEANSSPLLSLIFFICIALVVFIWVWPIAKGLRELTRAATAFGEGDFSVRSTLPASAGLVVLAQRFNAMAERIQRLVESHKELSHGVSHELRTPIARLRFAMEMVREVDAVDARNNYLDTMDSNIEELDGLVDELLVYARFDREEPKLDLSEHDIGEVVAQQLARFDLGDSHLAIHFDNEQRQICRFDRAAICRILDNLVRNAVRYANKDIAVTLLLSAEQVCLQVDDDGPGVPEQSRASLFKPFVRLDQSRDRNSGGIGLGLAIVKRLVELHQGNVRLTANDQGGARFTLCWPLKL